MLCSPEQVPANLYMECPESEDGPIGTEQGKREKEEQEEEDKEIREKGKK